MGGFDLLFYLIPTLQFCEIFGTCDETLYRVHEIFVNMKFTDIVKGRNMKDCDYVKGNVCKPVFYIHLVVIWAKDYLKINQIL